MTVRPEDCEVVSWHSRQKHEFLRAYLSIWTEHVGRRPGVVAPSLEIVDLFASYGWCRAREPTASQDPWEGTAVLAAQTLMGYRTPKRLFLNTFHPDGANTHRQQARALRAAIREVCGERPSFTVNIHEQPIGDALARAETVVDFRYPSIWLLDPYHPEDLPWEVVERIANQVHHYQTRGKTQQRRPELMISLMTSAMQRNIDLAPQLVTTALGLPEDVWRPLVERLRAEDELNTREALVSIYAGRLRDLYGSDPVVIEVEGVDGIIVYELVFCTPHPAGLWMTKVDRLKKYANWKQAEWKPEARRISKNKRILRQEGPGAAVQAGLSEFLKKD